jgi:hypothetical protein
VFGAQWRCCVGRFLARLERWPDYSSDCRGELVEGGAELVAGGDVSGDVVVAATQVLHEGVTGGKNPR